MPCVSSPLYFYCETDGSSFWILIICVFPVIMRVWSVGVFIVFDLPFVSTLRRIHELSLRTDVVLLSLSVWSLNAPTHSIPVWCLLQGWWLHLISFIFFLILWFSFECGGFYICFCTLRLHSFFMFSSRWMLPNQNSNRFVVPGILRVWSFNLCLLFVLCLWLFQDGCLRFSTVFVLLFWFFFLRMRSLSFIVSFSLYFLLVLWSEVIHRIEIEEIIYIYNHISTSHIWKDHNAGVNWNKMHFVKMILWVERSLHWPYE